MKDTINLLRKETSGEQKARKAKATRYIKAGIFVVVVLVPWFISLLVLATYAAQEGTLEKSIEVKKQSIKNKSETEILYRDIYGRTQGATLVMQKQRTIAPDIVQVKTIFNPNLDMQEFSFDKNNISVGVVTTDLASALDYLKNLENKQKIDSFLKDIAITGLSVDKQNGYQIKMSGVLF
jgi:hypothetical protein